MPTLQAIWDWVFKARGSDITKFRMGYAAHQGQIVLFGGFELVSIHLL